jgi:glycosidase
VDGYVSADLSDAVVYEANLRAFGPQPGFVALKRHLPALSELGVNVLWLMPVQPVGQVRSAGGLGSPYAVKDLEAINPEFGDADSFRQLIASAHELHMAVILDWVADHTSWDCSWIAEHPEWYLQDQSHRIVSPPGTGWKDVAALDYRCAPMRDAMTDAMANWITQYDVDGFRCDAADRMPADFWKTTIDSLRACTSKRLLMLAEGERAQDYESGFDLTYGWTFCYRLRDVFAGKPATELAVASRSEASSTPPDRGRLRMITNHDISAFEGSLDELYRSPAGAHTAFGITALYGGTPMIYTGQEEDWAKRIPIFDRSSIDWNAHADGFEAIAKVLSLRRKHAAFRHGQLTDHSTTDAVMFEREAGSDRVLVIANVRNANVTAPIPGSIAGRWRSEIDGKLMNLSSVLSLGPYEFIVLSKS